MWYGLGRRQFLEVLAVFGAIGLFASIAGLAIPLFNGAPIKNPWALLITLVGIPAIWVLLGLVLSTTWLHVGTSDVQWFLWKRVRLGTFPLSSLASIEPGTFSAVRIRTDRGTIHLLGLYAPDRERLATHLLGVCPKLKSKL